MPEVTAPLAFVLPLQLLHHHHGWWSPPSKATYLALRALFTGLVGAVAAGHLVVPGLDGPASRVTLLTAVYCLVLFEQAVDEEVVDRSSDLTTLHHALLILMCTGSCAVWETHAEEFYGLLSLELAGPVFNLNLWKTTADGGGRPLAALAVAAMAFRAAVLLAVLVHGAVRGTVSWTGAVLLCFDVLVWWANGRPPA